MRSTKFTGLKTSVILSRPDGLGDVSEIELEITGEGYEDPGNTYGPPENCYPSEGEVRPTRCKFGDWECEGFPEGLTESEEDQIVDALWEATGDWEPDYPDELDYDDDVDEAQEWYDYDPDC